MAETDNVYTALTGGGSSWSTTSSYTARPRWVRQDSVVNWADGAAVAQVFSYDTAKQNNTQFGNITKIQERDGATTGTLLRWSETEYFPNTGAHVVNLPARMRVYDAANNCKTETRSIYGAYYSGGTYVSNVNGNYQSTPYNPRLVKQEVALSGCSSTVTISNIYDSAWAITRYAYDAYGNQTTENRTGVSSGSNQIVTITDFDSTYHRFPIRRYSTVGSVTLDETAIYYGVNPAGGDPGITDAKAEWGAMAEWCGVNEVCTRTAYDDYGGVTAQWEGVATTAGWDTVTNANVIWGYTSYGTSGWRRNVITEWRAPRCYGNFSRKLYDGLGQLIQVQGPQQNWSTNIDGCNPGVNAAEVDVSYAYDALGNQISAGVPVATSASYLNRAANWGAGYTATSYDVLGRPKTVTAPNGEVQQYNYAGRVSSLIGIGRNGDPNKHLRWQENDALGNLKYVRTYNPSGSGWVLDAQVVLTHDLLGNLTAVAHPNGIGTTTIAYDLAGRKLSMNDPDLGYWSYAYDRQGQLMRQTDARNKAICLHYDGFGRLAGKEFRIDNGSPTLCANPSYDVSYSYDSGHSSTNRSRGQLTQLRYTDGHYQQDRVYNASGLLAEATVTMPIAGAADVNTTRYGYDSYLRPTTTIYPDNEVVTIAYNSMGLPKQLSSNVVGTIIDNVTYAEAGRLTQQRAALSNLYRTQSYWPWSGSSNNSNGRLNEIKLGTSSGTSDRFYLRYTYDSHGNIGTVTEQFNGGAAGPHSFSYDAQNRLISGYGKSYAYDSVGRLTNYEGLSLNPGTLRAHLSLPSGTYSADANGNLTQMGGKSLTWDHENHLQWMGGSTIADESYQYDPEGQRVKKSSSVETVYFINPLYEIRVAGSSVVATKYYSFNGQRVAMRQNSNPLMYLYDDHLGSTVYTTHDSGTFINEQGYYAYGKQRIGGAIPTDHKFTGQKLDGTGLYYYNARYYDPELGAFISPDTIVPDGGGGSDYNRYAYSRGNPLKFNDPSGHCVNATTTNKPDEITYNNDDCWRFANTIGAMWDSTDYWSNRFASKDVFNSVATDATNGTDFFQGQLDIFLHSDEGGQWLHDQPEIHVGDVDFGDYWSINGSLGYFGGALIADDYGNIYVKSDNNFIGSPGFGVSRGDILISNGNGTWTDIDNLGVSRADKAALAPNILVGPSRGGSAGYAFLAAGVAYNLEGPAHVTVESGGNSSFASASYSHFSYTFQIYPVFRYR